MSKGKIQDRVITTHCLSCQEQRAPDFQYGGSRYVFCPACHRWSIHEPAAVKEKMAEVMLNKYGLGLGEPEIAMEPSDD